jgi:hypothetical protein
LGFKMSDLQSRISNISSTRLSLVGRNTSNLKSQLAELNRLREQVKKAELAIVRSRPSSRRN